MDVDDDVIYSYSFYVDYYLPANEPTTVDMARLDCEDLGEVYLYTDGENIPVHHNDIGQVLFRRRFNNKIYMECLEKYDEYETEDEIDFKKDAKEVYLTGISELIDDFEGQLKVCENYLPNCKNEQDKTFIQDNIKYTKGIINNLYKLKSIEPRITIEGEELI
jgi:hypothetical protein